MKNSVMTQAVCQKKLTQIKAQLKQNVHLEFCHNLLVNIEEYLSRKKSEEDTSTLQKRIFDLLMHSETRSESTHLLSAFYNFFNDTNEHIAILDNESKFLSINNAYSKTIGYKNPKNALGLSYQHFKCDAAEKADLFRNQDISVLSSKEPLNFLSYHRYSDDAWHLLYGEKTCILNSNHKPLGIFCKTKDITDLGLIDISRFLMQNHKYYSGKLSQKAFTYYVTSQNDNFNLSRKEQEVLFYFIRGKTAKEIANILFRSTRTINMHLESIKNKFDVPSKSYLIEKAIIEGYMTTIPKNLLKD